MELNVTTALQTLLSLLIIIGLIMLLAFFYRRFILGRNIHLHQAKISTVLPLGGKERLVIVEIAGKKMLLGVTANSITQLHVFDENVRELTDENK